MARSLTSLEGERAWKRWRELNAEPGRFSRDDLAVAVRHTLGLLAEKAPGKAVEVRVIPFGAVQVMQGATHRRGTPPAVVETDASTWLALASGTKSWQDAKDSGDLDASGAQAEELAAYLPLSPES